jgi:anti-sigma factor RsiW
MNDCPDELRLSAYHDGELSPELRAEVASHVADCEPCVDYLDGLRQVSAWLTSSAAAGAGLSQMARARLHRRLEATWEQGLVRFGWELSGLAAAVLLAGSAWMAWAASRPATAAAAAVPPWVAARTVAEPATTVATVTPAAAWYGVDADSGS